MGLLQPLPKLVYLFLITPFYESLQLLQDEALLVSWKHQLDRDAETLKMKGNLNHLRSVSNFCCTSTVGNKRYTECLCL